jgi:hypothetical protein
MPNIVNIIELEAENVVGCMDIELMLNFGCCKDAVSAVESADPETESTSTT